MKIKENNNISKTSDKITNTNIIKEKSKSEWEDFSTKVKNFLVVVVLSILYTYMNYEYFRKLSVSEIISLNNQISFPFKDLYINITNKYGIEGTRIIYIKKNEIVRTSFVDEQFIDVKSVLNVSEIILEHEFKDSLIFIFFISKLKHYGDVDIINGIYTGNMSEGNNKDIEINKFYRVKSFMIEEEFNYTFKYNVSRIYQYYVRSHSIKTLNEEYKFSVIDDNENIRSLPFEVKPKTSIYYFAVILKKKIFYDSLEVVGESRFDIWWDSFGTITSIYEFIIPLFICCFHKLRLSLREENPKDKKLLRDNESIQKTIREMNDINSDII